MIRTFIIGLSAVFLFMAVSFFAFAEEKEICVEFKGISYCEVETVLKVGKTEVPVSDPFTLFHSAEKSQVDKIGLWEIYKYPPVITELARQLDLTEDEVIFALKDSNKSWGALYELTQVYGSVSRDLLTQTNQETVHRLFSKVINEITQDIIKQLEEYNGESV